MPELTPALPPSRAGYAPRTRGPAKGGATVTVRGPGGGRGAGGGEDDGSAAASDEEETEDVISDDPALGPENTKKGVKAIASANPSGPHFIAKVHAPTPIRQLCWVGPSSKLLASTSGADIMVWHVYMQRSGYSSWDMRVALRGVLSLHQKIVTDMLFLRDLGLVATTSMDASVALWGMRGQPDGVGGRRGFSDSPSYRPGYIQKLPKGQAAAGVFLVGHHKNVHARGIRTLLYVPSVRVLFTSGYENFIQAWDMAMDDGTPTYKLTGHGEGVVGMTSLEPNDMKFEVKTAVAVAGASAGANAELAILKKRQVHYAQIVTADEGGQFRWWDCARDTSMADDDRCLQCWFPNSVAISNQKYNALGLIATRFPPRPNLRVQPEGAEEESNALSSVKDASKGPSVTQGAVVLGLGSRLKCFEAVRQDDDRAIPAAALYHDVTMLFTAVTQRDIRFFDATNGLLTKVYRAALPAEAANNCVTFDARRRKLLVGCNGGAVVCINTFNCRTMKALPRHSVDVSGLLYCEQDSTVISTGWDGRVHVTDETITEMDGVKGGLMRRIKRTHGPSVPITALAFDYALSMIATAGGNGVIRLWDYQDLSFLGEIAGHDAEVTAMAFVSPWPVLVSTDLLGVVNVWEVARGDTPSCLASMAHRPSSAETPPASSAADEAAEFKSQALRTRMATFFGMACRRMAAKVAADGGEGGAAASPKAADASHPGVDAPAPTHGVEGDAEAAHAPGSSFTQPKKNKYRILSLIPSGTRQELAQYVQDPVTSVTVIPPTDVLSCSLTSTVGLPISREEGGARMVAAAGDGPARAYPTVVLGDEHGRITFLDMAHVLEPLSMAVRPLAPGTPPAGEPDVEREGLSTTLITGSTRPSAEGATVDDFALHVPLRRRIEPVPHHKQPPNVGSYHPRKIIKRSGPKPGKKKDMKEEDAQLVAELTVHHAEEEERHKKFGGGGGGGGGSGKTMRAPGAAASGKKAGAARADGGTQPAPASVALPPNAISFAQRVGTSSRTTRRAPAVEASPEEHESSDEEEGEGRRGGLDISMSIQGGSVVLQAAPPAPAHTQRLDAPAVVQFPSTFDAGEAEAGQAELQAPSRSISALARVVGDTWKPSNLAYAHGLFYDATMTDDPTASVATRGGKPVRKDTARGVGNGAKSGWKGFPVRSIRLVTSAELVCVITAAEDSTLRAFDLRGRPLAAVPVASGRRGADGNAAGAAGTAVVSALAQSLDWKVSLDCTLREHVLTSHAQACLESLNEKKARTDSISAATAAGQHTSFERADLREHNRRLRRSSIVAASDFLEPADAKKRTQMLALQSASGEAAALGASAPERARVIGQLFGAATWKSSTGDEAKNQAIQAALKAQGRRGSVTAQAAKVLGTNVVQMVANAANRRAEDANFSGPIPSGAPLAAPPRADGVPDIPLNSPRLEAGDVDQPFTAVSLRKAQAAAIGNAAAEEKAKLMSVLLADPSVRTLVELAQADAEERRDELLKTKGRKKRLDVIGLSGSTTAPLDGGHGASTAAPVDDDEEDEEERPTDDNGNLVVDLGAMMAALTPAERRLRQIRAIGARATSDSGGRVVVNGITMQDPGKAAAAEKVNAKEALLYPSFHAENHRPSTLDIIQAAAKAKGLDGPESKSAEGYVSPFLAARLDRLDDLKASDARKGKADASTKVQTRVAAARVLAVTPAAGGAKAAVSSLQRQKSAPAPSATSHAGALLKASMALDQALLQTGTTDRARMHEAAETGVVKSLTSLPAGSRLGALKSALEGVFDSTRDEEGSSGPVKHKSVAEMLRERNPELMGTLDAIKERRRRGSILVSMSDTAVQVKAGDAIAVEVAAEAAARGRRASFLVQRQTALDAVQAVQAATPALTAKAQAGGKSGGGGGSAAPGKGGRGGSQSPSRSPRKANALTAALKLDPEDVLTPQQFYLLSKKHRVGGYIRRDVLAFQELVRAADHNGDGSIGYDEFTTFIESGASGMRHMKGHLESLFRSADKSGDGSLSIAELGSVMFPKALTAHLKEIVLFVTYRGPEPDEVSRSKDKVYTEETLRQLKELFNMYDADGGGSIDRAEMAAAMAAISGGGGGTGGAPVSIAAQEEARSMMAAADESGDGEIDFDEFVRLMGPSFEMD